MLHEEVELNEIVQLVGKDSLSEDQKLTLDIANIIKGEFLQQDAFSEHDFTCPLEKVSIFSYLDCWYDEMHCHLLRTRY